MPISFTCPHCRNHLNVADQYAGQSGPCAKCGQTITIPFAKSPGETAGPVGASPVASGAPGKSGASVLIVVLAVSGIALLLCGGLFAALLIPAVQGARDAARRVQCQNNLKQITIALHNYHDVFGTLPPAYTVDADGKKLHSWRVLILPYLEHSPLYSQLKLDEPWDSPHNQALANLMPFSYRCPSDPSFGQPSVFTNYLAVSGPGTLFENERGVKFNDVTDGLSNTVAIVEAPASGIHWMEPRDMDLNAFINQFGQTTGPGGHRGGANVSLADGSVRLLSSSTPPQVRQAVASRRGGEAVQLP